MASTVSLWVADLTRAGEALIELEEQVRLLSAPERARAEGIGEAKQRERWVAAHVALHVALLHKVGRRVEFAAQGPAEKPRVRDWTGDFSLAHSGHVVLVAVATIGPVGVDVETRRTVAMDPSRRAIIEAAAFVLGDDAGLSRPVSNDETMRFLAAWTRLEALAKATGLGMARVLGEVGLFADRATTLPDVRRLRELLTPAHGPRLTIADIDLAAVDAVGAVVMPAGAELVSERMPDRLDALLALGAGRL